MKENERIAMKSIELPEEIIEQIREAKMSSRHNDLNALLEKCTHENTTLSQEDKDSLY